eukprot:COSAG04_NODE_8939_length_915_cov_1.102941_2_plen_67_part_01
MTAQNTLAATCVKNAFATKSAICAGVKVFQKVYLPPEINKEIVLRSQGWGGHPRSGNGERQPTHYRV